MNYILILYSAFLILACSGRSEPSVDSPAGDNTAVTNETADKTIAKPIGDELTITPEQLRAMSLQLGSVEQTTVSDEVKTTGTVDVPPQYMASISPLINGVIKSVSILPGQHINKGATLATLQSLEYIQMQQDYLQAISQLTYQQAELERQKTLNAEDVGAKKRLQQVQADYGSNQALVRSLALKLKTLGVSVGPLTKGILSPIMRITSPIGGFVTASNVHLGQQVAITDVLFQVMDHTHKHLELSVYENDAFKIKTGQTILLNDSKLGSGTVRGRVYLVGKILAGAARTITIHGHVDNEIQEARLIPGMFLNARILTGSRTAMTLPEEAVVRRGQDGYIYVPTAQPQTYRRVSVKLGLVQRGRVEIKPLKAINLTKVVVKGAYLLEAQLMKGAGDEDE